MKKLLPIILCIAFFTQLRTEVSAAVFTVNSTSDASTGAGTTGTLRWCIEQALIHADAASTINFAIPAGPYLINMTGATYNMWGKDITIDATTQTGWSPAQNPIVILRGNTGMNAFDLNGGRVTIKGFIFQSFNIAINFNNGMGGNIFENNWFGLDATGTSSAGNTIAQYAFHLKSNSGNNIIGSNTTFTQATRNVISGCQKIGIYVENAGANNIIANNYVGTNATGTAAVPNGSNEYQNHHGIEIRGTGANTLINRNVVSGNIGAGIKILNNNNTITITGNMVGTTPDGMSAIPNQAVGIWAYESQNITIGGSNAGATANIISGNGSASIPNVINTTLATQWDWYNSCGVYFENVRTSVVKGNYVGTDATGNSSGAANVMGNLYAGIKIKSYWNGYGVTVGGTTKDEGNIVGGNGFRSYDANASYPGHGILIQGNQVSSSSNPIKIYNNFVGISRSDANIGNKQDGISVQDQVIYAEIGGNGLGNICSYNNFGIFIQNNCNNNKVYGNYLGTNVNGDAAAGNLNDGIVVQGNSNFNEIGGNGIGQGNVISGNGFIGVSVRLGAGNNADDTYIRNNYIGLDKTGTFAIPNQIGVYVNGGSARTTIGGSTALSQGNYIAGNSEHGIQLNDGDNSTIQGNYIGLNVAGNAVANGANGIYIHNGSTTNTIGGTTASVRNVISSNAANGIFVNEAGTTSNTIQGNYIGTSVDGLSDMGNGSNGIHVLAVSGTSVTSTLIGGTSAGQGNVISGNSAMGVRIENSPNSRIQGNYIGTDATGTAGIGNGNHGLDILGTSNTCSILNNVISANGANLVFGLGNAISITDCGSHTVQGNYCGTNAAGTAALPNLNAGFSSTNSTSNTVGGTLSTQRNYFSGNSDVGVYMNNSDNSIFVNNYVGVSSAGTALGNTNDGIVLENGSSGNRFGGINAGEGNRIAHNGDNGINISGATTNSNSIHKNSIYCNAARGIELNGTGNDNYTRPTITVASTSTMVYGTSAAGATIEIFGIGASACATCPDDPDRIQGRYFIDFVTADPSGNWSYPFTGSRDTLVVTASVANANSGHNTSEFSACAPLCSGGTTALAGIDQNLCNVTNTNLAGNTPNAGDGETGIWTQASGPAASFVDASNPTTQVDLTGGTGTYVFVWSIGAGICPPSRDTVVINNRAVPTSNAGSTQDLCNQTSVNLSANTPTAPATGAWTQMSGPASTINTVNSPTSSVSLTGGAGTYVFRWTVSNSPCTAATSDVTINNLAQPISNAGTTQDLCNQPTATLAANTVAGGETGTWTQTSGPAASFGNANDPATTATLSGGTGTYVFVWTVTNGVCTDATSSVTINNLAQPISNAGTDDDICNQTSYTLAANTVAGGETGTWTQTSGPAASFIDANNPTTSANLTGGAGTYVFVWTVSNGVCSDATSTITINNLAQPVSNAGTTQDLCNQPTATLAANTVAGGETGTWTQTSGPAASFGNANDPATTATLSGGTGTYVFVWTVTNGVCTDATSSVTINNLAQPISNAGTDDDICNQTSYTLAANTVAAGETGTWTQTSGPAASFIDANSPTTSANLTGGAGTYVFVWTVSNGVCTDATSTITITNNAGPVSSAGNDQQLCNQTSATLSANTVGVGETGTWSQLSGPASSFGNVNDPATTATLSGGAGTYVFVWTVSDGGVCSNVTDQVSITTYDLPSASAAGPDQLTLCADNATLNATAPVSGSGQWILISGTGTITNDTDPASTVTGISTGTLTLQWVVSSGVCTASRDTVTIERQPDLVTADAGTDRPTCATAVTLAGNDPGTGNTGTWSSTGGHIFSDVNDPNATVSNLANGVNIITWTITGPCGVSSADVEITQGSSNVNIAAFASKDTLCVGANATVTAIVTGTTAVPVTYLWTSSDSSLNTAYQGDLTTSIEVTPQETGWVKYYVSVLDPNGCGNGAVDSVYSVGTQALKIPNLITPNGDDKNDCLQILDVDGYNIVPGSVYEIYNRWGQSVYKNENYANGDFCGSDLADGMYYFYLKTSCDSREFKGWLHILSNTGASNK